MSPHTFVRAAWLLAVTLGASGAAAQTTGPDVRLTVAAGRTLRIALDRRVTVKAVGQEVTGTFVEPVYARDRVVLPAGTRAIGRVAAIERLSRGSRVRSMLAGTFSPSRRIDVVFRQMVLNGSGTIRIDAVPVAGVENVTLRSAARPATPGRKGRIKLALIRALPYHPQLLAKGTLYVVRLVSPIDFGLAAPIAPAPPGARPVPGSILRAHMATPLGSALSTRGGHVEAVLAEPIFDAGGGLILPEGATLSGVVTQARPARRFHRHGQLRFVFEHARASEAAAEPLLASLHAVESAGTDRTTIDDEGGAASRSSNARFAAPALAAVALVGATTGRLDYDTDGLGPEMQYGGPVSGAAGGWLGLGLAGIGANALGGRYVTTAVTVFGLGRSAYGAIFGRGRDVSFPAGTAIDVQLAPASRGTPAR